LMTRRQLLSLPLGALALGPSARAQQYGGMASRGIKAAPRGKPSGRPFNAHFVIVGQAAGLTAPVIYGPEDHNDYIVESMGCGVAFLDYDDLWYPGHLSSTVDALAAHADAVAAFTACDVITGADKKNRRVIRVVGPTTRRTIYSGGNRPYINTLVARREAVAGVGGFDPAFDGADDLDLVHKLAERGRFVYVDEVTVTYRLHDHNWSRDTRSLASAGDRVLAAHLNRLRTAGDAEAAAGLAASRRRARRYYSERALRDAFDALKSGHIRLCAALLWWAVRFSPGGAATVLVQGTVRRLSSRGPGRCPR